MTRTKNPQPTSSYSDRSRESSLRIPNFILLGTPQPICDAKPLKSRPARMKHAPPANPKRSSRVIWKSAAKNTSGIDPKAPIDLEKEEEVPSQATEQPVASEKSTEQPKSPPKKDQTERKVREKREKSNMSASGSEKGEVALTSKGKHPQGTKKRKQPDMKYWNKKAIVSGTDYSIAEIEKNG